MTTLSAAIDPDWLQAFPRGMQTTCSRDTIAIKLLKKLVVDGA